MRPCLKAVLSKLKIIGTKNHIPFEAEFCTSFYSLTEQTLSPSYRGVFHANS